ncbi:MAG TPA: RDD family protein [Phytomonospora sp.]
MTPEQPAPAPVDGFTVPTAHYPPPLADVGKRLLARIIDGLVSVVLVLVLLVPGFLLADRVGPGEGRRSIVAVLLIIALLGPMFYEIVLTAIWGATLGKRVMKIRVVRVSDAGPVGWGASIFRALTHMLFSLLPCVGYLDPLWCLWDKPNRQTLHDKCVRSIVVRVDDPVYGEPAYLDGPPVDWRQR